MGTLPSCIQGTDGTSSPRVTLAPPCPWPQDGVSVARIILLADLPGNMGWSHAMGNVLHLLSITHTGPQGQAQVIPGHPSPSQST